MFLLQLAIEGRKGAGMNRFSLIAGCAVLGLAVLVVASRRAESSAADAIVRLQQSSPGVQQIGNANLSGTLIAAEIAGSGSALTNLDASSLSTGLVAPVVGGTGIDTSAAPSGSLLYTSGVGAWAALIPGTDSEVLTLVGGLPAWASPSGFTLPYAGSGDVGANAVFSVTNTNAVDGSAVSGISNGTAGIGVLGTATASTGNAYGGQFISSSTTGRGVLGEATATSGLAIGGRFVTLSADGRGVWSTANATAGVNFGVLGESASSSGTGVYGAATASTGTTFGVYGDAVADGGYGVFGASHYFAGGYGVFGRTLATVGGYGVAGQKASGIGGYGVYSFGNSGASGTKAFRIDDPSDPENAYLLHYSSEGPEPLNIYSGTTFTDKSGDAIVELPSYFSDINRDPRVQLTVDDESSDFVMVKVVGGVQNGRFRIRTSKGNSKVYWEVKAVRNDRWVQKYGAPVEVAKEGREKGTYQHPELYGLDPERGMNFDPKQSR